MRRSFSRVFKPVIHYRTGAPSLIHNLHGDPQRIRRSCEIIHRKYKETYGIADYRAPQAASKLLPLRVPMSRKSIA